MASLLAKVPTNELGAPLVPTNELGDPLPVQEEATVAKIPTPGEQQIQNDQQQLQKVRWAQANPWGTENNHPGKIGKIAHVLSVAGNLAGDILAPAVTANIPGSQLNMQDKEAGLAKRLNTEITDEGVNQDRAATTAKTQAETENLPRAEADTHRLSGAQAGNLESETNLRNNPNESWKSVPTIIGPNGEPVEYEERSGQFRLGNISGTQQLKQPKPDTPEQQYIDEYMGKLHPGSTVGEAERAYALDTQRPPQIAPMMMLMPNPGGGFTANSVRPGQQVAAGAITPAGLSSEGVSANKAQGAEAKAANGVIEEVNTAHQLAQQAAAGNAPADVDLALSFFKTIKGTGSGIRFTQQEQSLIRGSRNSVGDLEGVAQKVIGGGQMFTPEQRNNILRVMDVHANAARAHLGGSSEQSAPKEGDIKVNSHGDKVAFKGGKWGPA